MKKINYTNKGLAKSLINLNREKGFIEKIIRIEKQKTKNEKPIK